MKFFNSSGQLVAFQNAGGNSVTVSYSSNQVASVSATDGTDSWQFDYAWSGSLVQTIVFKVNGTNVRKAEYGYDGSNNLVTIKTFAYQGGSWGTQNVEAARYSYDANGLLRHVITPTGYRQMVNNGLNPDTASDSDLNDYAETEYTCDSTTKQVTTMYTHGRSYTHGYSYSSVSRSNPTLNQWTAKTEVALTAAGKAESSLVRYYFNPGGAVMLKQVDDAASSPTKTWNVAFYVYDNNCRVTVEADAAAILSVNDSSPGLASLNSAQGRLIVRNYDGNGHLSYTGLREGYLGTLNKRREFTYTTQVISGLGTFTCPLRRQSTAETEAQME